MTRRSRPGILKPRKPRKLPPRKWPAHMDSMERDAVFQQELLDWERKVAEWEAGLRKTRPRRPRRL